MNKEISADLVIIGAGTAGISAFKEASNITDKIILIDHGPLGTTCARVGCMPSKALIQTADYFYQRNYFAPLGILGADKLQVDMPAVLQHVRKLRDHFTSGTLKFLESLSERFIQGNAEFLEANVIKVGQQKIIANTVIIATGTSSIIPGAWKTFQDQILTSENIFEQNDLQKKIAVIGGGAIGLELGQALSRLGIEVELFHSHDFIGEISDPAINTYAIDCFKAEFSLHLNQEAIVEKNNDSLRVTSGNYSFSANQILAAMGRKPNLSTLNLAAARIKTDKTGLPIFDHATMQIQDHSIFIAGDAGKIRPLLHEAADEGRISGYNTVRTESHCFVRRTPLMIIFTQPNIAIVGKSYHDLQGTDFITGEIRFDNQGRARIMSQNKGILHIYAAKEDGKLLGAEMIAPQGEHLAHLLSHAIQINMTVFDFLQMPFYHPSLEEGVRTALRDIANQITVKNNKIFDLAMCNSEAITGLS